MIYIYKGTLDQKLMTPDAKRAYWTWSRQKRRCSNNAHPDFKYYGSKNITVEYTSREFIGWYLEEIKKVSTECRDVGRIDHSKNYNFGNISLQTRSENVAEKNERVGNPRDKKPTIMIHNGNRTFFNSVSEAARAAGLNQGTVSWYCRKKYIPKTGGPIFRFNETGGKL